MNHESFVRVLGQLVEREGGRDEGILDTRLGTRLLELHRLGVLCTMELRST